MCDHNKLWKALKETGIPDHLTCLLRNLEQQLEPFMEQLIGSRLKGVQGLSAVTLFFNLYAEHIMRNAGLDKLQAGIKIGGRNINNL